jgi:hypothetical protein
MGGRLTGLGSQGPSGLRICEQSKLARVKVGSDAVYLRLLRPFASDVQLGFA